MSVALDAAPSGVQEPTYRLVPSAAHRYDGDDAIALASAYGLPPDPWQELVLRDWLATRSDGMWAAGRCGLSVPRQNGKNALLEMRELFGMVLLGEKWLHTAHEVKTARKAFARLLGFFADERKYPELARLVTDIRRANGQEAIYLSNGGSVEFIARSKGSGLGFTVDVIAMDEAQELSDDTLAALMPTVSSAPLGNPQLFFTGTAPRQSMNSEVFTRTRQAALKGDDGRLCWHEWACEQDVDLDASETWARANPALGRGRLLLEAVLDERVEMVDETFGAERCGIWPDLSASTLFDFATWVGLADLDSQPPDGAVCGIDVSPDGQWAAVAVAGRRDDARLHVDVGRHGRGMAWVVEFCQQRDGKHSTEFVIDTMGPGTSLIPTLEDAGLSVVPMRTADVRAACDMFTAAVREQTLVHRGQPELDAAVRAAKPRPLGDGAFAFGRKVSGADITPLNAACFAAWRAATAGPYNVLDSIY